MSLNVLRRANEIRQREWWSEDAPAPTLSFRGNELAGEVGELCNLLKKIERKRLGLRGGIDVNTRDLANEMADVLICLDLLAADLGIDLEDAVSVKFDLTSIKNHLRARWYDAVRAISAEENDE